MTNVRELDFRALFDAAPSLFLVLDRNLVIVAATDQYLAATHTKREEILGRTMAEVFPENPATVEAAGQGHVAASMDRVLRSRAADVMPVQRYDVPVPGGFATKWWSPVHTPVLGPTGEVEFIIHRVEDVTEYVELEAQGGELAAEILRSSAELRGVNERLRAASEAKNAFLSRMSHELRTPLAAILGFSELLTLSGLEGEKHEWSAMTLRAGRHLLNLVNEVLDISRIESGDLAVTLEPVALEPIVAAAYELVGPLAKGRGVTLAEPRVFLGSGYVIADPQRLKQVLVNLLSNAVKYNREGGSVEVSVEPRPRSQLGITVTDTGIGIDAASLDKLFVPFERLGASATNVDGIGLGLALSRALAETMNGQLDVISTPGVGSTFTVVLSRGEPAAVEAIEAVAEEQRGVLEHRLYATGRSMLYVDDTPANVRLVEDILHSRPSVKVLPAMMGTLGLELAREHQPDLILLDLHLPDLQGDQVLAALKDDERTRDIPVVFLSADATGRAEEALLANGAVAFMTKPISVRDLLATIDQWLGDGEEA